MKKIIGLVALALVVTASPLVTADAGHGEDQMHGMMPGMMWSSGIMTGGFAAVFWVSLWLLIVLAIIYLVQEIDWTGE